MNTTEQILLIILSAALALFLLLAIVIAVQVVRLVKTLRSIADRAQELVNSAENTAEMLKNAVGKVSVLRFAHSVFEMVTKHKK
ncbi:MAG TPA: hypothetical protein VLF62_04250 [Candidatus Saccharimonadales bacterium]|nr:hypothetical protein [Candidatus Saccharimonadales bacterium]